MLELIKEIKSRNIKTKAWVAEDPKNRWAGLYVEDEAHWVERGITTLLISKEKSWPLIYTKATRMPLAQKVVTTTLTA